VVSDLQMPGMNGIELLSRVKDLAPETVRILLTGQAELEAAIEAVNEGNVFRFLRKPCPQDLLKKTLDAGLTQFRLQMAERDVLQQTLLGTVAVLTDLLATLEPAAFGRAARLRWCVRKLALELKVRDPWQFEAAAMLSQIGCIPNSGDALNRFGGEEHWASEAGVAGSHPRIARRILERVPRLRTVAQIIERQHESFENQANRMPEEYIISLGAHMLRTAIDFDEAVNQGRSFEGALDEMRRKAGEYNPEVLAALGKIVRDASQADSGTSAVAGALLANPIEPGGRPSLQHYPERTSL
jgi:response regulator RpfG family c-di-GMP phosphodiesterase